jgi:ArsR family transcriptional regulator
MRELMKVFKALSDDTRIRLLKLLSERELCVCELMQVLEMTQSRVSRNLGVLKEAGLVKDRRDGTWAFYSLDRKSFNQYAAPMLGLLDVWLNEEEIVKKDREKLKKAVRLSEINKERRESVAQKSYALA